MLVEEHGLRGARALVNGNDVTHVRSVLGGAKISLFRQLHKLFMNIFVCSWKGFGLPTKEVLSSLREKAVLSMRESRLFS